MNRRSITAQTAVDRRLPKIRQFPYECIIVRVPMHKHSDRELADPFDDENMDDNNYLDDTNRPMCGCSYCFCMTDTEFGEVCDDCAAGVHQG